MRLRAFSTDPVNITCLCYRRRLPTPILPEFKPPKSSDFEPTLSTHLQPTRARTDSDPLDPFQTRILILDQPTKTELEISTGGNLAKEPPDNRPMSEQDMESDSEDSQVSCGQCQWQS